MHSRRTARPPWERRNPNPRHPVGRTRRRWSRAYDGGQPVPRLLNPRYRRAYDGSAAEGDRRRRRRVPAGLQRWRESPVRNGLIGLAIAGAAAPLAINRYQQALRMDPAHERISTHIGAEGVDDRAIMERWRALAAAEGAGALAGEREAVIEANLERYADYDITRKMAEDIYDAAIANEIDPDLAFGLVKAESSFSNRATSHVGAIGLTQLMPRTAAWMEPGTTTRDLRDQRTNLNIGFKYLNYLIDKYRGNEDLALLAYNRGPGTVDRVLRQGQNPANGYVEMVLERAR